MTAATFSLPTTMRGLVFCHLYKAVIAVVVTASVMLFLAYDRRPPVVFQSGSVAMQAVAPGGSAQVDWTIKVARVCEGGVLRTITGSDDVVHYYQPTPTRPPPVPGEYSRQTDIVVPKGLPSGVAVYQVALTFDNCGLTSRWVPLIINSPPVRIKIAQAEK